MEAVDSTTSAALPPPMPAVERRVSFANEPEQQQAVAAAAEEEKEEKITPLPKPARPAPVDASLGVSTNSRPQSPATPSMVFNRAGMVNMDLEACLLFIRNLNLSAKSRALPAEKDILMLRRLLANSSTRVRGSALRAMRFIVQIPTIGINALNTHRIHLLACRCLEREKFLEERIQALKLFRAISTFAAEKMPRTLLRSVIAIASHRDDALKEACLESLREFSLVNCKAVAECSGISCMVSAVLDPSMAHLADSLLLTILHLLSQHNTRIWLRPALDLAVLLAPFTSTSESQEDAELQRQRRKLSQKAIVTMMRTWTGLFILASDPQGLRSLVQMLVQPVSFELRKDVLDTILLVFHTVNPLRSRSYGSAHNDAREHAASDAGVGGFASFRGASFDFNDDFPSSAPAEAQQEGGRDGHGIYGSEPFLSEYWGVGPGASGSKELASGGFHTERVPGRHVHTHNLMDNFLVMILLAFVQCGLVEALVELAVSSTEPVNRTATQLLSFVTRFSTRLLPKEVSRRLLSQQKLVASAVDAARAGQVVDRARAQRAAHVIGLLSRIVGSGYDTALATLLARSTYEDAIALAAELSMNNERIHINSGVFPKTQVISKRTIGELLTAQQPTKLHPPLHHHQQQQQPGGEHRSGGGSVAVLNNLRKFSRRFTATAPPGDGTRGFFVPELDGSAQQQQQADEQHSSVHPLVANRGHRRLVLQLTLTDSANFIPSKQHTLEAEVKRVLDKCRIMLKPERRNWKSWDWVAIDETLNGPCQNPLMFSEILKTKFFKRLSAFYAVNANGPFCQMRWDADCMSYVLVCQSMCKLLLNSSKQDQDLVNDILTVDRRGRLVAQIADSLTIELAHAMGEDLTLVALSDASTAQPATHAAATAKLGLHAAFDVHNLNPINEDDVAAEEDDFDQTQVHHRVFTSLACSTTMSREFFVLLGVFAANKTGLHLLDELNVFNTMTKLSLHREKDYLLRLFISNLDYCGSIDRPREWLQLVLMNSKISLDLRAFCLGVFRSLLRANLTAAIAEWLINMIFAQLSTAEVRSSAISLLVEACHYPLYLDIICDLAFAATVVPFHIDTDRELVLKLLAKERGVENMRRLGWLDALFVQWKDQGGYISYLNEIDMKLLSQLYNAAASQQQQHHHVSIPVRSHESDALSEPGFASSDLQFLFKLPWRIEVCADSSLGTVKVPMDCFIDLSGYKPGREEEAEEEGFRSGICITAVPPWSRDKDGDKRQRARPFIVPEDATVYASLNLASAPIDKKGRVHPPPSTGGSGFQYTFPREAAAPAAAAAMPLQRSMRGGGGGTATGIRQKTSKLGLGVRSSAAYSVDVAAGGGTHGDEDEMFDKPFAEAGHGGDGGGVEVAASLSDDKFWAKCLPQDRNRALKLATESASKPPFRQANPTMPGSVFPFSPVGSPAMFKFSTLEAQHRDSYIGSQSRDFYSDAPPTASSNEPEVKYVNPLMQLRKQRGSLDQQSNTSTRSSPRTKSNAHQYGASAAAAHSEASDLPPLLVLKEVRFYLELVPERSATPSIPVHLLGELAKTSIGAQEISNQQLSKYFVNKIKDQHESNLERRAALWAVGQIGGASELGFECLLNVDAQICRVISQVATEASCLSLRGSACYTLGMFSRHRLGSSALNRIGWATLDNRTHPFASIAVPNSSTSPFNLPGGRYTHLDVTESLTCSVDGMNSSDGEEAKVSNEGVEATLLTTPEAWKVYNLISDLSNHIAQKDAHAEISKIKETSPQVFADIKLYLAVHDLLARFNYELAVRQYVLGLFHVKISFEHEHTWQQIDLEPLH